ncbi:MAG: DUF3305 domain-containing protein [Burkholderiales bacterium]
MSPSYFSVDVVMERVPLANRWASERWQPSTVVPVGEGRGHGGAPECVRDDATGAAWRFPGMTIELHASEAEGAYLNLTSPGAVAFVMWRLAEEEGAVPAAHPLIVTLSYNEAGRFMDGGERVDTVPLAEPLRAWLAAFVAEHYKPEPKRKVRRNDPFKDGAFHRDRLPGERDH